MKNYITSLLLLMLTITAASQTLPVVRPANGTRGRSLSVQTFRMTPEMSIRRAQDKLAKFHKSNNAGHVVAKCIRKEKVSEGVYKNLYQCTVAGVWNKYLSQYAPTWQTYVTFDENAGTATFTNLCGFAQGYLTPKDVTAPMANGIITLPCKTYDGTEGSTDLGDYWGIETYLYAGDYDAASGEILADDELKFTIGTDYSTLRTDDKAMAIVYTYKSQLTTLAYVSKPLYDMANETASSTISTKSLDFGKTTPGGKTSASFEIASTGTKDVNYAVSIDNSAFTVDGNAEGTITALTTKSFTVTFAPTAAGDYSGTATITAADSTYKVSLAGKCVDVPSDFSPIFTSGDPSIFTWDNTSDFPWSINDDKQAVPGNLGQQPEYDDEEAEKMYDQGLDYNPQYYSTLRASYNSEKALRLTFDMYLNDDAGDSLRIDVDGYRILCYVSNADTKYEYSCVIPKGKHTLTFDYNTCLWAEKNAQVYIGNVRMEEVATFADVITEGSTAADFSSYDIINVAGKAYGKSSDAMLTSLVETTVEKRLSFEYPDSVRNIVVSTYDYMTDDYQELTVDGSGKFGVTLPAGFNGEANITIPKGVYVTDVRLADGKWESVKRTYQMVGTSYYDEEGAFMKDGGYKFSYPCDVTINSDGSVWFDGLFMPNKSYYPYHNIIKGRIGEDGKIHISAKKDWNEGTLYGWNDETYEGWPAYLGYRFWLIAGPVVNNEPELKDELVISMSDDKMQFTADDAFGVWVTQNYYTLSTSFEYWMPGTKFVAAVDDYSLIAEPASLDFGDSYPGVSILKTATITNNGKENNVKAAIEGEQKDAFSISEIDTKVASLASFNCVVTFKGETAGEYNANLVLKNDGEDLIVPLHATVKANIDYSAIVDEGADLIKWSVASAYPWTIEDGVAYSSNKGVMSSHSAIVASVDVPEGSVGTFSFQAASYPEPGYDSFRFSDGDSIYTYSYQRNDSIVYQQVLTAGHHDLKFDFYKDNIDEVYFVGDYASVCHVRLNITTATADDARLFVPEASFTELVPVSETYYGNAYIVNTGRNTLTVNSVTGDDHFSARLQEALSCQPGDTVHVYTTFKASEPGTYTGSVKFNTSAGVLELPLQATADHVVYLSDKDGYNYYTPYPTAWTSREYTNVTTQCIYNEDMTSELKGKDLLSMTFFSYVIADAPLTCEDVTYQIGTVSKPAVYDEEATGLTTVYSGVQPEIENYEMTIPFSKPYHFEGGHLETQLLLRAGESFRVQFPFLSSDMTDEYPQCCGITDKVGLTSDSNLPYVRFKYDGQTGIKTTDYDASKEIKSVSVYDISGRKMSRISRGINVIVTTYTDGTTHTVRQLVR